MSNEQNQRYAGLIGVAGSALAVVGTLVMIPADFMAPVDDVTTSIVDDSSRVVTGAQVAAVGFALLAAFGAVLYRRLSDMGARGLAAGAGIGYGITAAVGLIAVSGMASIALRADEDGAVATESATAVFDWALVTAMGAAPVALAVGVAATGIAGLQSGFVPRWLGLVAMPLALALLILPINWAVAPFGLLWTAVVGAVLASTSVRTPEAVTA